MLQDGLEVSNLTQPTDVNQAQYEGDHSSQSRDVEINENGSVKSAGVDGSVGSDTDTSKHETMGKDADGRDQIPRYSVKKAVGFKPVSVTKNFLAKAGSVSTLVKASGDKGNDAI